MSVAFQSEPPKYRAVRDRLLAGMLTVFHRDGEVIRHLRTPSSSTHVRIPDSIRATSER